MEEEKKGEKNCENLQIREKGKLDIYKRSPWREEEGGEKKEKSVGRRRGGSGRDNKRWRIGGEEENGEREGDKETRKGEKKDVDRKNLDWGKNCGEKKKSWEREKRR